jgi:GT2 family glycosyltransferase
VSETLAVTLAICTYSDERFDLLCSAIDSFVNQARPEDQVLVVVDHNDSLLQRVHATYPDLPAIANDGPRGLSGARNAAIKASSRPLLAFLDDDGVVERDFVESLVPLFRDPTTVAVGCRVEPVWERDRPAFLTPEFDWVVGCSYRGLPTNRAVVRNPLGGAMMMRRDPVAAVGGFWSDLGRVGKTPLGCEETELFIRLGTSAFTIYVPDVVMHHFVPEQRCTWRYFTSRCFGEGLSKAVISLSHRPWTALRVERKHVTRTLPAALWSAAVAGRGQAVAGLAVGTASTAAGYVFGRAMLALPPRLQRRSERSSDAPLSGDVAGDPIIVR